MEIPRALAHGAGGRSSAFHFALATSFGCAVVFAAGLLHENRDGHSVSAGGALLSVAPACALDRREPIANRASPMVARVGSGRSGAGPDRVSPESVATALAGQNHFVPGGGEASESAAVGARGKCLQG